MNACRDEWSLQYNHWSNYDSFFSAVELTSTMVCVHRTAGLYSSLSFRKTSVSGRVLSGPRCIRLIKRSDPSLITPQWRLFNEFFVPSNSRRPQWWCWPPCNLADWCALLDQNKTGLSCSVLDVCVLVLLQHSGIEYLKKNKRNNITFKL